MSSPKFICLHIAKTAGGTLKKALKDSPALNVKFLYGAKDRETLAESDLGNVDLIYGHTRFGIHDQLGMSSVPRYFCYMRHPVSRVISHYYHLRNVDRSSVGDKIRKSTDINNFFDEMKHWEFNNFMTRVVSGNGRDGNLNDDQMLDEAKKNLDHHFDFVGFQEFFTLSGVELGEMLGTIFAFEKDVNVGRYDLSDITDETMNTIVENNRVDMLLYKYAIQKFL